MGRGQTTQDGEGQPHTIGMGKHAWQPHGQQTHSRCNCMATPGWEGETMHKWGNHKGWAGTRVGAPTPGRAGTGKHMRACSRMRAAGTQDGVNARGRRHTKRLQFNCPHCPHCALQTIVHPINFTGQAHRCGQVDGEVQQAWARETTHKEATTWGGAPKCTQGRVHLFPSELCSQYISPGMQFGGGNHTGAYKPGNHMRGDKPHTMGSGSYMP